MRLVSRQAATGCSSSPRKWWQSGLARFLFNTPTTQLWYATGTDNLVQLDTSLESGNGIGEPVSTFLEALSDSACLRCLQTRLNPTAKGPVPQPPQEHPSEGQLWVRYGTGLHIETPGSFSLLGYLVLFSTEGTLQQHAWPPAGHSTSTAMWSKEVSKGPSYILQPNFESIWLQQQEVSWRQGCPASGSLMAVSSDISQLCSQAGSQPQHSRGLFAPANRPRPRRIAP